MTRLIGDLILAFGLLSRLPLPKRAIVPSGMGQTVWAWPLVGCVVGGLGAGAGALAMAVGLPAMVAAATALIAMALATGGMHEDGLADTSDGLWGGPSRDRRLEIMRDSRIGAYGVLALLLITLLRFAALVALAEAGAWIALVGAAAVARAGTGALMSVLRPARHDGLAHAAGQPSGIALVAAIALSIPVTILCGLPAICWLAAGAAIAWIGWQARSKIGGHTGDILGAGCLLAETAALIAAT
ncbi:MAG: adenosylcobinamide-GDP ribazoletransferase [Pseudomonadota bacterium]